MLCTYACAGRARGGRLHVCLSHVQHCSVCELPLKTPVYATLAALLNSYNAELGRDVAQHAGTQLTMMLSELAASREAPLVAGEWLLLECRPAHARLLTQHPI